NLYGTRASLLEGALQSGQDILLDIDTQGAAQLRKRYPEAVLVFIVAPSMSELEQRLRERRSDAEKEIARRLDRAREEIATWRADGHLRGDRAVDDAGDQRTGIIPAERTRTSRLGLTLPDLELPSKEAHD